MLERGPESPRRLPSISVPPRLPLPASVGLETCVVLCSVGLRIPLVWGLGVEVYGAGFWVLGSGFRVWGLEFRVLGFGFRVSGFGFRVSGFGFRV